MNYRSRVSLTLSLMMICTGFVVAQGDAAAPKLRQVSGHTILSTELPAADLIFAKSFRYIGGQFVNLYGNAEAEQHLFVQAPEYGQVERFYWVQFEHFLPSNQYTYDYSAEHTTDIGGRTFIYDVKSWPDYAAMQIEDPGSDGAAISRLLGAHGLFLPTVAARVRMFQLPTPDRRSELMIIYGETIHDGSSIPVGTNGTVLDKDAPDAARLVLDHAKRDLTIHTR